MTSHDDRARWKQIWHLYSPGDLRHRSRELSTDYLIAGLLPQRAVAIAIGESGIGKSPLLYQAALSVAAGIPFLGFPVKQGRVLYFDFENGFGQVDELVCVLAQYLGLAEPPGDLLLWNLNDCSPKWGHPGYSLLDMIREVKPALAIIDSLGSYQPEVEEKNSYAIRLYRDFRAVIRDCGTTILSVHHIRKPSSKLEAGVPSLQGLGWFNWFLQARGARALINGADVRLGMEPYSGLGNITGKVKEEIALVMRGFERVKGEIPLTHLARVFDEDGEPVGYKRAVATALLEHPEQERTYAGLPEKFRFKEARQAYGKGPQATTDFLNKCIGLGLLKKVGGEYHKVHIPDGAD